jgi:microcystin degradation protein MlrC
MKFVIAAMLHETNTFSPVPTTIGSFVGRHDRALASAKQTLSGEAAIGRFEHANVAFGAFVQAAREARAEFEVPLYASAQPSAPVDRASFETMCEAIVGSVRKGCDAVMLDLHGAMVAEGFDDAEGELVRRVRSVLPGVPIAVALDFHANIGRELVDNVDIITGYRTYPHVDMRLTGERAARTLMAMLRGECRPAIAWQWLPMLTHTTQCAPSREPMKSIMDRAIAAEAAGEVLNASVFGGFPQSDIPQAGYSVMIVGRNPAEARKLCDELARTSWDARAGFVFRAEPLADTIARAKTLTEYPVVLADHGNNAASGGSCDTMASLAEVLRQGLRGVLAGPYCDPQAVAQLIAAGVGNRVTLEIGGRTDMPAIGEKGVPLKVTGTVRAITDGRYLVTGPMMTGVTLSIGRSAVLDLGDVQVVLSEERVEPFDLGVFTHCGLDPLRARYILIHSRQHFRAGFEPIARHILMVAGPGVCSSDFSIFGFKRLTRPLYPLDPGAAWTPA